MLYLFLKTICRLILNVYFRKIHVEGRNNIPKNGPYLIVANHPSTFLDPISIAAQVNHKISFLAKGVLFQNKFIGKILKALNMVPIYRAEDNPKMLNKNTEVFKSCYKKLKESGVIMIFPEGTSEMERRLRKIKTGAARIALGAEKENNFTLDMKILPVGLNYTKSSRYRSEVFVNFGEAINVREYYDAYLQNEIATVKNLSAKIEEAIRDLIIAIDKEEHEELVERIESIYKTTLLEKEDVDDLNEIKSSQAIVEAIDYFQQTNSIVFDAMATKIDDYYMQLERLQLSNKSLEKTENKLQLGIDMINSFFALLLGFPIWLFGIIASYIPYKLPRIVALKISDSEAFYGGLLMSLGTIFFILFYGLEIFLFWLYTKHLLFTVLFGILLVSSGFFTIYYARNARRLYFNLKLVGKLMNKKQMTKDLIANRKELIEDFDRLRDQYLNRSVY